MTKKMFYLVSTIIGAVATTAIGFVTYYEPSNATAITSAISAISTVVIEACAKFIKEE